MSNQQAMLQSDERDGKCIRSTEGIDDGRFGLLAMREGEESGLRHSANGRFVARAFWNYLHR